MLNRSTPSTLLNPFCPPSVILRRLGNRTAGSKRPLEEGELPDQEAPPVKRDKVIRRQQSLPTKEQEDFLEDIRRAEERHQSCSTVEEILEDIYSD